MKPVSYLVLYRDSTTSQNLYFGHFVNEGIADFFKAVLPEPTKGGVKKVVPLQPFGSQDAERARETILTQREYA